MAPGAMGIRDLARFPYDKLKGMPIMEVHGDDDQAVPVDGARATIKALKEHGLDPVYVEVKGGTHASAIQTAMPQIFDFFDTHARKAN
jgi:predicted esterase